MRLWRLNAGGSSKANLYRALQRRFAQYRGPCTLAFFYLRERAIGRPLWRHGGHVGAATVARPYPQAFEASGIRHDAVPSGWRILGGDANIDYKELLR